MMPFACQCWMVAQRPIAMTEILLVLQVQPPKEVDQMVLHCLYHHLHCFVTHVRHWTHHQVQPPLLIPAGNYTITTMKIIVVHHQALQGIVHIDIIEPSISPHHLPHAAQMYVMNLIRITLWHQEGDSDIMPHHVLNMTQTLFLLLQLPDHIIIVMVEGEACHLLVLHLLLQQLADHQLTSAPFLHLPLQIHRLAAAAIADSKAGSDWFCYCQYHSVVLICVGPCVHTVFIPLLREICYTWEQGFCKPEAPRHPSD